MSGPNACTLFITGFFGFHFSNLMLSVLITLTMNFFPHFIVETGIGLDFEGLKE